MLAAQRPPFQRVARIRRTCRRSQSTAAPSIESSRVYCQNLLRTHDYASFLQAPFIPSGARDAHLAIRALNVELALIPDTVSNQNARTMRMQFWKDAVEDSFKGAPKAEPVSILLANVLANRTRLTKSFFQTMISERSATLSPPPFPNIDALETHLSKTTIPLYYLLLESIGLASLELDHISSHIGLCVGIVTTVRGIPFRLKLNDLPLPLDICARHNLVQEQVFREGPEAPSFKDVVLEVATRANDHLSTARQYIEGLKETDPDLLKSAFSVFLPAIVSREYLAFLEKVDFDPFVRQPRDWKLPYRMWRASLLNNL